MEDTTPLVLVTGYTGFVGKVVVEELVRRTLIGELPDHKIVILIRSRNRLSAQERFDKTTSSICWKNLDRSWTDQVEILDGDLTSAHLELSEKDHERLTSRITHIIHCAAAVDFDLTLIDAAKANVDTTQNVLSLAKQCGKLRKFVHTSTAYVNPAQTGLIPEDLAPLPLGNSAEKLYADILAGKIDTQAILASSGHDNTYTLTKNLSEHMLYERRGSVPVTIVRPSIVTCAWQYPFPGYITSYNAIGGVLALFGSGFLHVIEVDNNTSLDYVPVDVVANHLIDASGLATMAKFDTPLLEDKEFAISSLFNVEHSAAGLLNACNFGEHAKTSSKYFSTNGKPVRRPFWKYCGPKDFAYHWHSLVSQTIPITASRIACTMAGRKQDAKRLATVSRSIKKIGLAFPYFCHNTFDFEVTRKFPVDFTPEKYMWLICEGIERHLIRRELWITSEK